MPFVIAANLFFGESFTFNWQGIAGAIYVGLFEMGITFVLWLTALKKATHIARISNLIFISPFLSLLLISFILGEPIAPSTFYWSGYHRNRRCYSAKTKRNIRP